MGQKKPFSTRVDEDKVKELKHLAVDTDKSLGELLEEAITDLVKKYKSKPTKWSKKVVYHALPKVPHMWKNGEIRKPTW